MTDTKARNKTSKEPLSIGISLSPKWYSYIQIRFLLLSLHQVIDEGTSQMFGNFDLAKRVSAVNLVSLPKGGDVNVLQTFEQ